MSPENNKTGILFKQLFSMISYISSSVQKHLSVEDCFNRTDAKIRRGFKQWIKQTGQAVNYSEHSQFVKASTHSSSYPVLAAGRRF